MGRRPLAPIESIYPHGSDSCYRAGCGCRACMDAHTEANRLYKARKAAQLEMFPRPDRSGVLRHRKRLPHMPPKIDLAAVAAAVDDPRPGWDRDARCRGNRDLADLFHAQIPVQIRSNGTESLSAPGDFVPEQWQSWCADCPVWADCVADAIRFENPRQRAGFWGSTPTQRGHIARALARLKRAAS